MCSRHFLHYSFGLQNMYMYSLKIELIKNIQERGQVSVVEADMGGTLRSVVEIREWGGTEGGREGRTG